MDYTLQEMMVVATAREIRDGEMVFVGMRLPMLAFALAKRTHAPRAFGLYENGIIRDAPSPELLYTISDPPNIPGAIYCNGVLDIMAFLHRGHVDVGFVGGAEVDRFGNVNTSVIGDPARPQVRLPGSGGGADIACLARRLVIIMEHDRRRFRERVDYVTSAGYGDGGDWRRQVGLPRGGPAAIVSTLGVFRFDEATKEARLSSYHRGQSVESVRANTGWELQVAPDVKETAPPTADEVRIIRGCDPHGFWTR